MSANNWAICPSCVKKHKDGREKQLKEMQEAYGMVPIDSFNLMQESLKKIEEPKHTLEEYYETYTNNGVLEIKYESKCTVCGFRFKFEKTVNMLEEKI